MRSHADLDEQNLTKQLQVYCNNRNFRFCQFFVFPSGEHKQFTILTNRANLGVIVKIMQSKQIIVSIPQSGGGTDSELEARVTALEEAVGDINTILEEIIGE